MEKQIALAMALLLWVPFVAFADQGTAKLLPATGIMNPCNRNGPPEGPEQPGEPVYEAEAGINLWDEGASCGHLYCVVCVGATSSNEPSPCRGKSYAAIRILAPCPDCGSAAMRISKPGFEAMADPNKAHTIEVQYKRIFTTLHPCA